MIREPALRRHTRWLADDKREGRMPGEAGYDVSAQYVAEQFAQMGLEPAGTDGWFQHETQAAMRALVDAIRRRKS